MVKRPVLVGGAFFKRMKGETIKTIEVIDRLHDSGDLQLLCSSGLIDPAVIKWRKIYHSYYNHRTERKVKKLKAAKDVGEIFSVSWRTVYNVLERFNYEMKK